MTAQFSNSIEYEGEVFNIAQVGGEGIFEPQQYGLQPTWWCTACYCGYLTHYQIQDQLLFLQTLEVCLTEPSMGGTKQVQKISAPEIEGRKAIDISEEKDSFEYRYENMNLPISFEGSLLIARDFIDQLYEHIGFHPAWKYRKVKELKFENGKLIESTDLSDFMEEYRNAQNHGKAH